MNERVNVYWVKYSLFHRHPRRCCCCNFENMLQRHVDWDATRQIWRQLCEKLWRKWMCWLSTDKQHNIAHFWRGNFSQTFSSSLGCVINDAVFFKFLLGSGCRMFEWKFAVSDSFSMWLKRQIFSLTDGMLSEDWQPLWTCLTWLLARFGDIRNARSRFRPKLIGKRSIKTFDEMDGKVRFKREGGVGRDPIMLNTKTSQFDRM